MFERNFSSQPGRRWVAIALGTVMAAGLVLAACGDSDEDVTAQERYCAAGDELSTSVDAVVGIDVIAVGQDGVAAALDQVGDDASALSSAATEAAGDQVKALEDAVAGARDAISNLGDDISADSATAVVASLGAVETAATAVYATLTDCD